MNRKRILTMFISCILGLILLCGAFFLSVQYLMVKEAHREDEEDIDALIILGAKVYGMKPSRSLRYRLDRALVYLKKHPETLVVVSGGQGDDEDVPEAFAMRDYLVKKGYDKENIVTEEESTSTWENLLFSKTILDERLGDYKAMVVSNDYHLYRARMLAERMGMEVSTLSAKTPTDRLLLSRLREFFAIMKSFLVDR